jgi:hypothetical protein
MFHSTYFFVLSWHIVRMRLGVLNYMTLYLWPRPHHPHVDTNGGILASRVVTSCLRSGPRRRRCLTHPVTDLFIYLACACSTLTLWPSMCVDDEHCCVWTKNLFCFMSRCWILDYCHYQLVPWSCECVNLASCEFVKLWICEFVDLLCDATADIELLVPAKDG